MFLKRNVNCAYPFNNLNVLTKLHQRVFAFQSVKTRAGHAFFKEESKNTIVKKTSDPLNNAAVLHDNIH